MTKFFAIGALVLFSFFPVVQTVSADWDWYIPASNPWADYCYNHYCY